MSVFVSCTVHRSPVTGVSHWRLTTHLLSKLSLSANWCHENRPIRNSDFDTVSTNIIFWKTFIHKKRKELNFISIDLQQAAQMHRSYPHSIKCKALIGSVVCPTWDVAINEHNTRSVWITEKIWDDIPDDILETDDTSSSCCNQENDSAVLFAFLSFFLSFFIYLNVVLSSCSLDAHLTHWPPSLYLNRSILCRRNYIFTTWSLVIDEHPYVADVFFCQLVPSGYLCFFCFNSLHSRLCWRWSGFCHNSGLALVLVLFDCTLNTNQI